MPRGATARDTSAAQKAMLEALYQQPAAHLIGWSPRGLRDSKAPRNPGGTYNAMKLVQWFVEYRSRKPVPLDPDDPDIFAGGDSSPNLERCRAEKARELKRKNDRAEELLIEVETVGMIIDQVGRVWRERVKSLQQVYGVEIGDAISDMVDDAFGRMKSGVKKATESRVSTA